MTAFAASPDLTRASRRGVLMAGFGALMPLRALASAPATAPQSVAFEVWRQGARIGEHSVRLTGAGGDLVATIEAHFVVSIGPIPVFRYRHAAVETWRNGRFASFEANTLSNGRRSALRADRTAAGVAIRTDGAAAVLAAADTAPLTHWNMGVLSRPLFNPQNGKVMRRERVQALGAQPVTLASGKVVDAQAFALSGEAQITDWYDAGATWTGLRARVMDGSSVDYRRVV